MTSKFIEDILPPEKYREVFNTMAHFAMKLSNTNAAGAIRIDQTYAKTIPYAAVCTSLAHGKDIPTDYTRGAGDAKAAKHLRWATSTATAKDAQQFEAQSENASNKTEKKRFSVDAQNIRDIIAVKPYYASVKTLYEQADHHYAIINGEKISPRLTQLLLPKQDGYIAVTPLASAGYGCCFSQEIKKHDRWLSRVKRSLGGANPQNIGGLVYWLTKPLLMSAPHENAETKRIYQALYKSIPYVVPRTIFEQYAQWRKKIIVSKMSFEHNARIKRIDLSYALKLSDHHFKQLRIMRDEFDNIRDQLPEHIPEPETDSHRAVARFLLGETLSRDDRDALGLYIATKIARFEMTDSIKIGWDNADISHFGRKIGESFHA